MKAFTAKTNTGKLVYFWAKNWGDAEKYTQSTQLHDLSEIVKEYSAKNFEELDDITCIGIMIDEQ